MSDRQPAWPLGLAPTITGLLCGIIALLWLSSVGQLEGEGITGVLALYATIGGTIAVVGKLSERAVVALY
jgi:hypothetical protein